MSISLLAPLKGAQAGEKNETKSHANRTKRTAAIESPEMHSALGMRSVLKESDSNVLRLGQVNC